MSSDAATLSPGALVADRFRVIQLLGIGGMGAVYEVEHELTLHRRALKLLHRSCLDVPEVVGRFVREASAAGRIGSRHIVETFDAGQLPSGEPYLVMELLRGETLSTRLERQGRLELSLALEVVRQAAIGIQAAHDAGIVHRDLKPENLFLVEGPSPAVKILDFGISRFDPELTGTPSLTTDGTTLGTPYYMSPEQVRGGEPVDGQADVYALGVVLYECLTGKPPFVAETLPALCVLIHEGEYEKPRNVPAAVVDVIAKAMARDRKRRYATARDLAEAIERAAAGEAASFGDTLAVPSMATPTVRRPPAEARSIAPPPAEATEIATKTQLSRDVTRSESPSRRALYLGATIVAAAVLGFLVWRASAQRVTAASIEPAPAPSALPPVTLVQPTTPSAVAPAPPDAVAPRAPAPPARDPRPASSVVRPKAQNQRAKEHGLGTEDPFGP